LIPSIEIENKEITFSTELEKNTTTTTDSPYENYKTPTTTENQFLIPSTETFSTEQAENNTTTTTYSSSENNTTATTTTEVNEQTETEIENETATINKDWVDQMRNEFNKMQRLGENHNKNNFCK
jgi:hypothetical protein